MYKHCRLCLTEDVEGCFNQFNYKLEDNLSVYECYKLFTLICFQNENEQIKSKICYKCLQKLTTFNNDRNQAVANNQIIASWLDKYSHNIIDVIKTESCTLNFNGNDYPFYECSSLAEVKLEENPVENQRTVTATKVKFSRRNVKSKESPRLKVSKVPFKKKSVKIEILNSFLEANPFKAKKNPLQKSPNDTPELKNDKRKCGRKILCPVCGVSVRVDALKKHNDRVHLQLNRYFCDICSRGFYSKYQIKDHLMRHLGDPSVPCLNKDCTKKFFSTTDRRVHISAVHTERPNDFPCTYPSCSLTYDTVGKLNNHIKYVHLRERKHICPNCQEGFFAPKLLREHMTRYMEKNFVCDGCGNLFNSLKKLRLHFIQTHMNPPLACSVCGKKFKLYQKKALKIHELDHQNIRNHPCEICLKQFLTKAFKLEHIRAVHFKSKIKCELCGRSFPRPGYYKVHVKEKHEDLGAEGTEEWLARIERMRADYDKLEWVYD